LTSKKLLLVGGEDQFQRVPGALGDNWQAEAVGTGEEALAKLAESPADAVVCCMDLQGMSGSELLKQVSEQYGGAVRFLVYGASQREVFLQSVGSVHQYIPSPVDPASLAKSLENSLSLHGLLTDEKLCSRLMAIKSLPSPPEIYSQLVVELSDGDASMQKIADLIGKDVSITAKLLQMVNSAYFGLPNRVGSVLHATNLLGLDTVKSIVFSAGAYQQFDAPPIPGFSIESIYNHSVMVGAKARLLATAFGLNRKLIEESLMAGMMSDIGQLVMLTNFADELQEAFHLATERSIPLDRAEREIFGVSDAKLGAYLLKLWGLPDSILEAVALHYVPHKTAKPAMNALAAVHLAYATDWDETHNIHDETLSVVDMEFIEALGIADQLTSLRGFCSCEIA